MASIAISIDIYGIYTYIYLENMCKLRHRVNRKSFLLLCSIGQWRNKSLPIAREV